MEKRRKKERRKEERREKGREGGKERGIPCLKFVTNRPKLVRNSKYSLALRFK